MTSVDEIRTVTAGSSALRWVGVVIASAIAGLGIGLGIWQHVPAQQIILYAVFTFALVAWIWNYYTGNRDQPKAGVELDADGTPIARSGRTAFSSFIRRNRPVLIGLALLLLAFGAASITVDGFFSLFNIISLLVLGTLLVLAAVMTKFVVENKSAFIGLAVVVALLVIGSLKVDGFVSAENIKSMLLFASFLGLACVGQTLVALLGGLDLSIPFVMGAANVGLLFLIGLGVPSWLAVILILLAGLLVGLISGFLSFWLQGQALILTLGVGFAVSGLTQILTSIGTRYSGNVFGSVPGWLTNLAAMNGTTFGLNFPPVILIWAIVSIVLIIGMRNVVYGRYIYALGGNRSSAQRLSISERRYWVGAYTISSGMAAATGELLLGWSGGGFIGVGQPYLFMSLAAVVVGGTSLLGGVGGYGFTVIGVLVLQLLTSLLVGIGLSYQSQQFIFGLLIVPMVALYARSPHIRTQI